MNNKQIKKQLCELKALIVVSRRTAAAAAARADYYADDAYYAIARAAYYADDANAAADAVNDKINSIINLLVG